MTANEPEIAKIKEKCKVEIREDAETGWKLYVGEMGQVCQRTFKEASRNLGPHSKQFLARRIETDNPDVRKALDEVGLSRKKAEIK